MSAKLEVKAIAKCIALQSCLAWIRLNRKWYARTDNFICAMICCNYFFFIDIWYLFELATKLTLPINNNNKDVKQMDINLNTHGCIYYTLSCIFNSYISYIYSDLCLTLSLTNMLGLGHLITVTISHLKCFALKSTKLYIMHSTILPSSIWNPVV